MIFKKINGRSRAETRFTKGTQMVKPSRFMIEGHRSFASEAAIDHAY